MTQVRIIDVAIEPAASIASGYLNASLRRTGFRRPAGQCFGLVPPVRDVALRLALYLSDVPTNPFTDRPILDGVIEAGFTAYFTTHLSTHSGGTRFLQACTTRVTEVLAVDVRCEAGHRWDPCAMEPLGLWRDGRGLVKVDHTNVPDAVRHPDFRRHVLALICSQSDALAMGARIDVATLPIE